MRTSDIFKFTAFKYFALLATSTLSALGFFWPFINSNDRPEIFFWLATPIAFLILMAIIGQAKFDAKSLALLAVLSAIIAALRPLGAGAAGIEPMWFLLILSSYIFGSSFGFVLGSISMMLSAFLTGGFGPWLPYQVFAAGWVGLIAGSIPQIKRFKKFEIPILMFVAVITSEVFGILMDLQFWPWALGPKTQLSYLPGEAVYENLNRFFIYHFSTSMAWNVPRAIFTAMLIAIVGPGVLQALRRSARKANFSTEIRFT